MRGWRLRKSTTLYQLAADHEGRELTDGELDRVVPPGTAIVHEAPGSPWILLTDRAAALRVRAAVEATYPGAEVRIFEMPAGRWYSDEAYTLAEDGVHVVKDEAR